MIISSSPNWYSSSVIKNIDENKFAFCSRSSVFCYSIDPNDGISKGFCIRAFDTKCTVISVISSNYIAAASDSGEIKTFKLTENFNQLFCYKEHQYSITAIDSTEELIVSGDTKSTITVFNLNSREIAKIRHAEQHADVKAITIQESVGAIGYEKGIIYIINLRDNSTVIRLRGHECDIQSMLFLENYFVSSSRDKFIKVWDKESFICCKTLRVPKASGYKSKRGYTDDNGRSWISLSTGHESFNSHDFISSGNGGDIILWHLKDLAKVSYDIFCESQTDLTHQRVVFGFARCGNHLVSTSMDREMKVWDLISRKPKFSLITNGGFIYSISKCSIDDSLIAYGVGDGMFRVWNFDQIPTSITAVWQGVKEKVTALSWHKAELKLAFGTELGKVGHWSSRNNKVVVSNCFHKKTVYSVGFINDQLLSCGGDAIIYNHSKDLSTGTKLSVHGKFSTFATSKDDYCCLGHENGKLELFKTYTNWKLEDSNPDLHTKYITVVRFSKTYMVSCSNTGSLVISRDRNLRSYRSLGGHAERVNDVDFNPENEHEIVTASLDGTCQIWNIENSQALHSFRDHGGNVYCVLWQKEIFSGGDDYVLRVWSATECTETEPPAKQAISKTTRIKRQKKTKVDAEVKTEKSISADEPPVQLTKNKKVFGSVSHRESEEPFEDVVQLCQSLLSAGDVPEHLLMFVQDTNQSKIKQIVKKEVVTLLENNFVQQAVELSTWTNSMLAIAGEHKITDLMVALSASAGHSVWRAVTEEYITQLKADTKFSKAAAFLMSMDRVAEAVATLLDGRLFRESLLLARLHAMDEVVINNILLKWADRSVMGGNLAQAAKCHLGRTDVTEAINVLRRRNDPNYMLTIVRVAALHSEDNMLNKSLEDLLNPVVNFGRWEDMKNMLINKEDEISLQLKLYLYFHWKIATKFHRANEIAFQEIDNFDIEKTIVGSCACLLFKETINMCPDDSLILKIDKMARIMVQKEFEDKEIPSEILDVIF